MAEVIQIAPVGLLDYFKIKNGGRNPSGFNETIAGTFDLRELYDNVVEEVMQYSAAPLVIGGALGSFDFGALQPGIVPQNEYWYIRAMSIDVAVPVNVKMIRVQPTIQIWQKGPLGGTGRFDIPVGDPVQSCIADPANPIQRIKIYARRPFWMPPLAIMGGTIGWLDPVATNCNAYLGVRMVRFRT